MNEISQKVGGHLLCRFRYLLLAYVVLFLALTFPFWMHGEVIAPFRQAAEIAAPETSGDLHVENRKFVDYVKGFIPEISAQINGRKSGWLTTWRNENELGRPLSHIAGFSPAYVPSWLILHVTHSPYRYITFFSLGTIFLAGLFMILLSRELQLSPLAGLIAGASLTTSPLCIYWLTFPLFTSVLCWSAGVLYAVTRLARRLDLLGWSVLAFSVYSLLMTANPQMVIFNAYLVTAYCAYLVYNKFRSTDNVAPGRYILIMASAVVTGGVLVLPVYLDLVYTTSESARLAPDITFFAANLPKIDSFIAAIRFLVLSTFPDIIGNPMSQSYPFLYEYKGLSVTPVIIFFAVSGLLLCFRKTWGWWLAIFAFCALTFIHPLFSFAVRHLGFNLSRSIPLVGAVLPVTLVMAYGADALLQQPRTAKLVRGVIFAAAVVVGVLLIAVAFGMTQGFGVRWSVGALALLLVALLVAQADRPRPALLVTALVVIGVYISFPMMLRQDPAQLATNSPLVEKVRENLPPGSRYAVVSPDVALLPPNLNATLGLASVHTYNSLSSRRYHRLIKDLGGEVIIYGRRNESIAPDYGSTPFWMSNISLILSLAKLNHENLAYLGQTGDIHLYGVKSRMGCCLQVPNFAGNVSKDGIQISDPRSLDMHQPAKTLDQGDVIEFDVKSMPQSLLILSQKFHRDWQAQALTSSGWSTVTTVPVNGVFQGVLLPDGTTMVHLQYKPYVRFAWIAHLFWLVALAALFFQAVQRRRLCCIRDKGHKNEGE